MQTDWQTLLNKAKTHKILIEINLNRAVLRVARKLGFSEKQAELFTATFSKDGDADVLFNGEGERAHLYVELMAECTKEQVIERLIDSGISKVTEQLLTE